jgi:PAS domain S-box-containing protein
VTDLNGEIGERTEPRRTALEEALRATEQKYRSLLDNLQVGVFRAGIGSQGRFMEANPALAEMLGYDSVSQLMDAPVATVFADPQDYARALTEIVEMGGVVRGKELRLCRKDGMHIWAALTVRASFDEYGSIHWLDGVMEDITERKKVEDSLRRSEEKYRILFERIADPIFIFNKKTHHFIDCNDAVQRIYGYSREELRSMTPFDLHPSEDFEAVQKNIDVHNLERPCVYTHITKDGQRRSVEILSGEIEYDGRAAWISIVRDISERTRMEGALMRAERMAAVGTLASGVAHEFNNMHGVVLGYLELVLKGDDLTPETRQRLEAVYQTAERAAGVTRNLLAFARKSKPVRRRTLLSTIVDDTLKIVAHEFSTEGIDIEVRCAQPTAVCADAAQLGQVIMNLLINARHAMLHCAARKLTIETGQQSERAFIRVTDTGCGIEREHLPDIFLPFFSTKGEHARDGNAQAAVRGSGLGLSVCQRIVKDHEGEIAVESTPGEGTSFTIRLPLQVSEDSAVEGGEGPLEAFPGARILVLEDEDVMRILTASVLGRIGYDVAVTDDGAEGLRMLREEGFDLVLVDLQMPKMSGEIFLRELMELPPARRPVSLVVTGRRIDASAERFSGLNVFDVVEKPWKARTLCERIHAALTSRKAQQ